VAGYPSPKRRNLEKTGRDIQAGQWRISSVADPITEKKYLQFSLRLRSPAVFSPLVVAYRLEAARLIAGPRCLAVASAATEGDRLEILTPWADTAALERLDEADASGLLDAAVRSLALFENHAFYASDLFPETFARDEAGRWVLLPPVYVLPVRAEARSSGGGPWGEGPRARGAWTSFRYPAEIDRDGYHARLIGEFLSKHLRAVPGSSAREPSSFRARLVRTAQSIARGEIATLATVYESLFDAPLEGEFAPLIEERRETVDPRVLECVDRVLDRVAREGSVTVVAGRSRSGKTRVALETAERLGDKGESEVIVLDEWDLFAKHRAKFSPTGRGGAGSKQAAHAVWIIDDIDEKTFASSEFSRSMIESDSFPRGAVVLTVGAGDPSKETAGFLAELETRRRDLYERIVLGDTGGEPLEDLIRSIIRRIGGETPEPSPEGAIEALLGKLTAEQRQLLELASVARFSVPADVALAVFPEPEHAIALAAQRLVALGILEDSYRQPGTKSGYTLFFRTASAGLRRLILERLAAPRRRALHRTLALAAEETGYFPSYFLLYHALRAGDAALAARHLVRYLKDTVSERRDPFVITLYPDLIEGKVIDSLPFGDRVLACSELSRDLFRAGNATEAESLLLTCEALMESAETDQKLKSAALLASSLRLLTDWWERRGEYKRALELLDTVKFELQSALSIPDQASLLNDIGWLQYRLGDYDASMESCRLSLNTLNPNQHPLIVAQALNLMGVVHYNSSRYDEAISYYEQSAQLRERTGDENATAASLNNLALAYQAKAEYEKALDYFNRSLRLKRRQNNQPGIAAGYLNLAGLYVEMRNFKEAEAKCRESLAVCEMLDEVNAQAIPGNYMTLGDIAVEIGDLGAARDRYHQSLDVARKMAAINEEMGAYRRLSAVALREKRFDEARRYAKKASDLVDRIGSKYEAAQIEEIFGDVELEQDRRTDALKHYEKAAAQYTALSKYRLALKILSKIGLIHAEAGNTFEARQYLDRAQDYVRADIGHELPEEYNALQRQLRGRTAAAPFAVPESQKMMLAFYEMSALTDYARDAREFLSRLSEAIREIASPNSFIVALSAESGAFVTVDPSGARHTIADTGLVSLFSKTLSRGSLLESRSPDAADLLADLKIPGGGGFVSIPLKAMGDGLGCLVMYFEKDRSPLSREDANFFVWFGRQAAAGLSLMLHLNPGFLKEEAPKGDREGVHGGETKPRFENLIGKSEPMRKIFRTLDKIKDTDSGILILGESGTGKSALARAIHYRSPRRNRPFREIHCAQIPHGLLESELFGHERGAFTGATHRKMGLCETADGGTLFLDDINVVPNEIQAKLLRFIENKTFVRLGGTTDLAADVRIVAASNEDLEALCREGRFREDLYFRLKVILIDLPPLRERPEDTIAIALDYLKRSCAQKGIPLKTLSPEAIQLLQKAPWRGNVRELQNVLERVVVLSEDSIITPDSLPEDFLRDAAGTSKQSQRHLDELVEEIIKLGGYSESSPLLPMLEALIVYKMVSHVEGKGQAAELLGISKPTLYARLKDYEKLF
jgi:DNA-binding NtrC family response regulator/tetratricopeptide (TPR) repeat protein